MSVPTSVPTKAAPAAPQQVKAIHGDPSSPVVHDHNGSTSVSESSTPREDAMAPSLYCSLVVEVVETQRWYPILGWTTSMLANDPANFSAVRSEDKHHHGSPVAESVATFQKAFLALNATTTRQLSSDVAGYNSRPVYPLEIKLPPEHAWVEFWSVRRSHPYGTDPAGWRYSGSFSETGADQQARRAHFKKTPLNTSCVRYRVWQRHVRTTNGPTDSSGDGAVAPDALSPAERETLHYLEDKQDEMRLAEKLKDKYEQIIAEKKEWTPEMQLQAEEELRSFIRARQEKKVLAKAEQDVNPFQPSDAHLSPTGHGASEDYVISGDVRTEMGTGGAVAASSWAVDSKMQREREANPHLIPDSPPPQELTTQARIEEENLRYSFNRPSTYADEVDADENHAPTAVDGLQTENSTVNRFVSASRDVNEDGANAQGGDNDSDLSKGLDKSNDDFDSIFQKFVSNPEDSNKK